MSVKATFLDLITLLNGVFVGSSRSIAFAIGSVPIDSLNCIVSCAIIDSLWKGWQSVVWALCSQQRSSRSERVVIRRGLGWEIRTHQSSCPGKVLRDLDFDIA